MWNLIQPPLELAVCNFSSFAFNSQVISSVGDLVGIKYFPAEPNKLQKEEGMIKEDWLPYGVDYGTSFIFYKRDVHLDPVPWNDAMVISSF